MFSTADAIFAPLAARQVLQSRTFDVQTARNDALLNVAEAFFNVQQARGRLAGARDACDKGRALAKTIAGTGKGLVPDIEVNRAAHRAGRAGAIAARARGEWAVASAS